MSFSNSPDKAYNVDGARAVVVPGKGDRFIANIGAPHSSAGEGHAHPGGRFDVTRQPAGNGLDHVRADVYRRLQRCKTKAEGYESGISRDLVDAFFDQMNATKDDVNGVLKN